MTITQSQAVISNFRISRNRSSLSPCSFGTNCEETLVSGFYTLKSFLIFFTGQVAKIPPFKELDLPLPVFDGLDLKKEQKSSKFTTCNPSMDVLDLYETGEWTAANSPSSELFDDVDIDLSSVSDIEDPYISDFSIDFAPYLDNATLNSSPDDLYKYITSPKEPKVIKESESLEPFLPEEDLGYMPQNLSLKVENKSFTQLPAVSTKPTEVQQIVVKKEAPSQKEKLPSGAAQLKAPSSRRRSTGSAKKQLIKGSPEYRLKRERNNIAVRKSRFKSKQKFLDTQQQVEELAGENDLLQAKVSQLTKELNVLRNLVKNTGLMKDPSIASALLAQGIQVQAC